MTAIKSEGYLAHKWGLNGELHFSHPYFTEPPPDPLLLKKLMKLIPTGTTLP